MTNKNKLYQFGINAAGAPDPPHTLQLFMGRDEMFKLLEYLIERMKRGDDNPTIEFTGKMHVDEL